MRAFVEIPSGEPFEGTRILNLECAPRIGEFVGDQNGRLYKIEKVIHMIDRNESAKHPFLKLIVSKEP